MGLEGGEDLGREGGLAGSGSEALGTRRGAIVPGLRCCSPKSSARRAEVYAAEVSSESC